VVFKCRNVTFRGFVRVFGCVARDITRDVNNNLTPKAKDWTPKDKDLTCKATSKVKAKE